MTAMNCPLCEATAAGLFEVRETWIAKCSACGHLFADLPPRAEHVQSIYADSYFYGGGAGYADYTSERDLLVEHGRWYGRLLKRYAEPGKLLDVGSAAGFILRGLADCGWLGEGIEPNERMASFARSREEVLVHSTTLEQFQANSTYNLVTMIQVIAHFQNPREAIRKSSELLSAKGLLLIETWNPDSWVARLLGKYWHEYSPPSVLHYFSPAVLTLAARKYGLSEVGRGRPSKWLNGAHMKSLLGHVWPAVGRFSKVIPDGLRVPYPSFDLYWILFEKASQ